MKYLDILLEKYSRKEINSTKSQEKNPEDRLVTIQAEDSKEKRKFLSTVAEDPPKDYRSTAEIHISVAKTFDGDNKAISTASRLWGSDDITSRGRPIEQVLDDHNLFTPGIGLTIPILSASTFFRFGIIFSIGTGAGSGGDDAGTDSTTTSICTHSSTSGIAGGMTMTTSGVYTDSIRSAAWAASISMGSGAVGEKSVSVAAE
ncbi:hypothetical protein HNY73_014562 [Argiope bruennichi]|uniref:Uncharacterized protein n=1 Tax=Argiope bruennichi TaxID=94029 RepID=A0A8T0EPT6_ARGBR|nr:hypothetical protein HNY73_014562 [Argiope bruennichi]